MNPDWLIPDWPAPSGVRAVFTTRQGGVSVTPWDSMNLGDHVGDAPALVAANRELLAQATGANPVFLQQIHGWSVLPLDGGTPQGQRADAAITSQRRIACTIMVADCLPVLLTDTQGSGVAAAHAGWRGLAGEHGRGVLEQTCEHFWAPALAGQARAAINTIAWLGPCIGPAAFEVGAEVRAAFVDIDPRAAVCFTAAAPGKYLADLAGLARLRLQALGITQIFGNDGSAPWCTVGNASRFFSHRRDAGIKGNGFGTTGRMAACIWLE
ncbi:MAG: peptidoglycan editing factor PgeF [Pseudomonadota bacterium]|uniref:peptidoglycan editing factor PgeF n=1 Tax=Polaromonas sp. TaxID=1869339 RepID=UPI0017C0BF41|nr:peptidoglycan editing factor PgeF [Polaromonas sp.]MBA3594041.1 peptidoglycan editing factor PgeF [Polaromonas sp.]MDQ3270784.1 peptidoglycan editing factor PgeF [Pseudomonadota bacterium]